jgi:NADPH-dependent curcumin reductase CurA
VVICGATAAWTAAGPSLGPRLYWPLLLRRAQVEGFSLWDHQDKYDEAFRQVARWLEEGHLKSRETIVEGFDNVPNTFAAFLRGTYFGKVLVRVAPESE